MRTFAFLLCLAPLCADAFVAGGSNLPKNAENDARRAIEAAEEARDKANEAVEEFNRWVQYGY